MDYVIYAITGLGLGWYVPHLIIEKVFKVGPRGHPRYLPNPKKGNV